MVISNGVFTESNRYPYRYVSRSNPGFNNNIIIYLLPPLVLKRTRVNNLDFLYTLTQRTIN